MSDEPGLPFGYHAWCSSADGKRSKLLVAVVFDDAGTVRYERYADDLLPDEQAVLAAFVEELRDEARLHPVSDQLDHAARRTRAARIVAAASAAGLRETLASHLWTKGNPVDDLIEGAVDALNDAWEYHEFRSTHPTVIGEFIILPDPPSENVDRRVGEFQEGLREVGGVDDLLGM
jgi:hypothetical protein